MRAAAIWDLPPFFTQTNSTDGTSVPRPARRGAGSGAGVVSMAVIELMFPNIYGGNIVIVAVEGVLLVGYLTLAWMAAKERPP